MGIFAADKRLLTVRLKKLSDIRNGCIHLAFDITGIIISAVTEYTFIMYEPCIIKFPETHAHIVYDFTAE